MVNWHKIKLILFFCILITPSGFSQNIINSYRYTAAASGSFTFVNSAVDDTFGDSAVDRTTATITLSVTAGNLIVMWTKMENNSTISSISDGSQSMTLGSQVSNSNNDLDGYFSYILSAASTGSKTYTVTFASNARFIRFRIAQFSYTGGTCVLDKQNTGTGSSATATSGNITTTGTVELVLGSYGEYTPTAPTNLTINSLTASTLTTQGTLTRMFYKTFTSTFTGNASCNVPSPGAWICNVISFKLQ